ncbi:MAG: hypothetical protein H0V89_08365 [Deltaproteobacteria bacterium]|nr:hypothetical protein [Deltaproteobacteria bacterium]
MIALLAIGAWAADPPVGMAGQWRLARVETSEESWNYADKVRESARYAADRCHEMERLVTLSGEDVELTYRWMCDEPGLGTYVSERSVLVSAQWSGSDVLVPPAEGVGRFVRVEPPDPATGRRAVAILPAQARELQLGPVTWKAELVPPSTGSRSRSKESPMLRLTRKNGEIWILAPVAAPVPK